MARPPRFTPDGILDAASTVAARHWRDATTAQVAEVLGTPPGSIYYRFPSREDLFVSLWLRSIGRFHEGLLEAAARPDPQNAAVACALHIPRFCREHHDDAVAMTLYRRPELIDTAPESLRESVIHVNDRVVEAMRDLAARRYGDPGERHLQLVAIACQESPYGLVRRYLRSGVEIPEWLDDVVRASTTAILAVGDQVSH